MVNYHSLFPSSYISNWKGRSSLIPNSRPTQRNNNSIVLLLIGSFVLAISVFLPYIVISNPSGGQDTINGIKVLLAFIFLAGAIVFGFLSTWKFNNAYFREDFSGSRNLALVSSILGVISIALYYLAYQLSINDIKQTYGVDISSYLSFGVGFYGFIFGTILIFIAAITINGLINRYPSKWPNRNQMPYYDPNSQNPYQSPINPHLPSVSILPEPSQAPQLSSGKFCTNCGTKYNENQNFCTNCGVKM